MKVNKTISIFLHIILLNVFLLGQFVHAKSLNKQHVNLDSHVHGLSEIMLAIEGKKLNIQLISPAVNLIGFEHRASNKKEAAIVNNAKALLSNTALLFAFSGGDCSLINTNVEVLALIRPDENENGHEHQPKDNKNAHEDHRGQQVSHENHTQVVANYRYHCEEKSSLAAVNVLVFDQFPGVHKIRAMWITDTKQSVVTLSAESRIINL